MSDSLDRTLPGEEAATSTEVLVSPKRKRYSVAFKLRIIEEAERCSAPGELAALLRREAIYFSTLADFRKQKARGDLDGKRAEGTPQEKVAPQLIKDLAASEREVRRLRRELERAKALLELQKKLSEILGLSLEPTE